MHSIKRGWTWVTATRRRQVASVLAVLTLVGAGAGIAAWLTTVAQPPANVKLGTLVVTKVTPVASPTNACVPGGTCDAVIHHRIAVQH